MTFEKSTLIHDLLLLPISAISYSLSEAVTRHYPNSTILETRSADFNISEYAKNGGCQYRTKKGVHSQVIFEYHKRYASFDEHILQSWFDVQWQNHNLEVVQLSWIEERCSQVHFCIIADVREIAEKFLLTVCDWNSEVRGEVLVFDNGYWRKSQSLFESIRSSTFENLVLPEDEKQLIQNEFRQFFEMKEIYKGYGVPWKRGALFLGPPGNGKTHTIKALANSLSVPCLYVKSFKGRYQTDHETIHTAFEKARQSNPCLLVLEDLDSLIDDGNRSYFLNELDGFASNEGIVIIATTNHPGRLDPAILDRPSRFDRKYSFGLPAAEQRSDYLSQWSRNAEESMRLSLDALASVTTETEGFSYAYLKELWLSSIMQWMKHGPQTSSSGSMDEVMLGQIKVLRGQMTTDVAAPPEHKRRATEFPYFQSPFHEDD